MRIAIVGGAILALSAACDMGGANDFDPVAANIAGLCGNGQIDEPEQCDDGNQTSGDGCSEKCLLEFGGTHSVNDGCPEHGLGGTPPAWY